ncbi:phytanoyl-CoA dioxygenase domain-containing protein 1 homolog [Liolophura sinensis]|uniref:phytanoyl-CoA dioxygenase domain-containing protein 1 homolog n=1 Tax=Liolophura sinensis TaxID=3198878 RepID=UPI003158F607
MATEGQLAKFKEDGYVVLDNFLTEDQIESLKSECWRLVEEMKPEEHSSVFETGSKQKSDDYFMNSVDKIRYFYEAGVVDEAGRLKVDKHRSLNKIGHGPEVMDGSLRLLEFVVPGHEVMDDSLRLLEFVTLKEYSKHMIHFSNFYWYLFCIYVDLFSCAFSALHYLNPVFRKVTFGTKVKDVAKCLGLVDPVVAQSMYIFKQPGIGGEVVPHQDASFLYTQPFNLYGYWIPLEDVTLENGCLWFIPGSHKDGLLNNRRFVRNPNYAQDGKQMIYTNPMPEIDQSQYVPVEVKKGSLVLIHGLVVHKSEQNKSNKSRHVYTFHVYDAHQTDYSQENWILPTAAGTFAKLYHTSEQ